MKLNKISKLVIMKFTFLDLSEFTLSTTNFLTPRDSDKSDFEAECSERTEIEGMI